MRLIVIPIVAFALLQACTSGSSKRFDLLQSGSTGITFTNTIVENDTFNVLTFEYIYNGGGVAVGDFNNDGFQDLFFAGNQVSSALYINRGDMTFEEVTIQAGVSTKLWCTGVALVDINSDGLLDIYVSTIHPHRHKSAPNLFFLNRGVTDDGVPVFDEVANALGIADNGYSTQAVFFDFDNDSDMDLYLVNNALEQFNRNTPIGPRNDGNAKSVDRLYLNEGTNKNALPNFKDVSREAGMIDEGWGLGVVVNDFNHDGWPDVYVSNDFLSSDHLWINQRDGSFKNEISKWFKHTEYNGMGMDIADINNDGFNDVMVTDMMPEDNARQKSMFSSIGYDRYKLNFKQGYQTQVVRNVLQLNNGNGSFSDIGYLSGIYATDWSWSGLFADFDNDGYRDLLVTNGYKKDITDLDFTAYSKEAVFFGSQESRSKKLIEVVNQLEGVYKPNFIFKNNGDLTFTDKAADWGLDKSGYSNGAAYADFDNDGDLDIVVNNINHEAFIYRNNTQQEHTSNYARILLKGNTGNPSGIGSKVHIYFDNGFQYAEQQIQRGYKSTVEPFVHFGLGKISLIDSIVVLWPSGLKQTLKKPQPNTVLTIEERNAKFHALPHEASSARLFEEVKHTINYKHTESDFVDYKQGQSTLLQQYSCLGPGVAVADINGDGLDDVMIGAAANLSGSIYIQKAAGKFDHMPLPNKISEDMGVLLFDADGDGDKDLYCVSGSSEFGQQGAVEYQDRFYENAGGKWVHKVNALPKIMSSGSTITACDYDRDGDLDLFVGGRIKPVEYPLSPQSYLLQNDGTGQFADVTKENDLDQPGMVSSALWSDYDNDGWIDLILVGEWMPIKVYHNERGKLKLIESAISDQSTGWWNSITGGDFDNDGDIDYVAGNLGLNSVYQSSSTEPVSIYAKDFDNNGSVDPLITRYVLGKQFITHPRETLTEQIVSLKKKLQRYSIYGQKSIGEILGVQQLNEANVMSATCFTSMLIQNEGAGKFSMRPLPTAAQVSPMHGLVVSDINGDDHLDIVSVGNLHAAEPLFGRYDAGIGTCLVGDGSLNFSSIPPSTSGFFSNSDTKGLAEADIDGYSSLIVTANQDSVQLFRSKERSRWIPVNDMDVYAIVEFEGNRKQKMEFYWGSGYLSQSTRKIKASNGMRAVTIFSSDGKQRRININSN